MNELIDAVIKRVGEIAITVVSPIPPAEDSQPDNRVFLKSPTIFDGYIPYNKKKESSFPYVIVRMESGSVQEDNDLVKVKMLIGGFSDEANGYKWGGNLLSRIKNNFAEFPVLEKHFVYKNDLQWKLYDDQPFPYWYLEAVASWYIQKPQVLQGMECI